MFFFKPLLRLRIHYRTRLARDCQIFTIAVSDPANAILGGPTENIADFMSTAASEPDAVIGILMLETQFPRILGDIGNAASWPFPVRYKVVQDASAAGAVRDDANTLTPLFIEAANELVSSGVVGLTTSCGFLSLVQNQLAAAVKVPFVSSSLMQVSWLNSILAAPLRTGILTIDAQSLTDAHLTAVQAPMDTPIAGLDQSGEFVTTIMDDRPTWNLNNCRTEVLLGAAQLVEDNPDIGAIVLECTNMVPYAADINQTTGLPVYSIHTLVHWLHSGLAPISFQQERL